MTDIAALGVRIDTSSATAAKKALDDFAASATPAARAAENLGKASGASGKALQEFQKSGQLARHELINLSRQMQDVGVSLASGQSPLMVLVQQGAQIADIYGSSKTGTVGGSLKQLAGFVTPMRALAVGAVGLGAAGYSAYSSWKSFTLQLDDTARAAGTSTRELSKLQAAASSKGIAGDEFNKGVGSFANQIYQARNNMGGLAEVLRANGVPAVRDFEDGLGKAANLIQRAGSDQQRLVLLQQMGLPATMEWVRLLSGGADGLKRAKDQAAEFAADDRLVRQAREFDEAWNKAWTNFGLNARSAIQGAMTQSGQFMDLITKLAMKVPVLGQNVPTNMLRNAYATNMGGSRLTANSDVSDFYRGLGPNWPGNKPTVDKDALRNQISLEQQRLGILGQLLTVDQQVRMVELSIQQARLNGASISTTEANHLKDLTRQQALGITQMRMQSDAYQVEIATLGMSTGAATAYANAQNVINQYRRLGVELSADQIAAIQREAEALGKVAQQAENLRFAYDTTQSLFQNFGQAVRSGSSAWDAFRSAGLTALGTIADKLTKMAVDNLWSNAFGGSSGSGLLGSLFGIGGGNGSIMVGDYAMPKIGFASGGYTGSGGKYEPAGIVHRGEYVFDAASTARIGVPALNRLRGYADGGLVAPAPSFGSYGGQNNAGSTPNSMHITVETIMGDDGKWHSIVKDIARTEGGKAVSNFVGSPAFVSSVGHASTKARQRMIT